MRKYLYPLSHFFAILWISSHCYSQTFGKNGMVVSDSKIASQIGVEVMKKGGNVIDACVATAFTLAVTHPQAGNIGGGGFLVYVDKQNNATTFDFREKAPLASSPDMFLNEDKSLTKGNNHNGMKSVGVPGTVAGLYDAHTKYGSLPWADLVQPAIDLAKNGFPLSYTLSQHAKKFFNSNESLFMKNFYTDENGNLLGFNDVWKQPELAKTLTRIRDNGKDGFYKGETAKLFTKYIKENGGIIRKRDLKKYESIERKPLISTYKGYIIYAMPPPSSGGVALIEMMNMMEYAGIERTQFNSTAYVHTLAESMKRVFADRAEHLGDPDFNPNMPISKLISKEFAKQRFKSINKTTASKSDSSKFGQLYEGNNTTHFSAIDKDGNSVSLTYTLEYSYGARDGSPKLGFIFNNEMGDFNPQPNVTTSKGQIGSTPNIIQPEKRMLSSMSPTIITKSGNPYLIIGSPGGRTIINTVFQTVLNVLAYEMPIKKAIESMKIHHQWLPDIIFYEKDLMSPDTKIKLEEMGHNLSERENLGRLMGIQYDKENEVYIGACDSSSPDGGVATY